MHIIIIGGGFAGLSALLALRKKGVKITLIDKDSHFEYTPALPFCVGRPKRIGSVVVDLSTYEEFVQDEVVKVEGKEVVGKKERYAFDKLIVASGAVANFFGNKSFEKHAIPFKRVADVEVINGRLADSKTVAVIGGGYTGIEVAAELIDLGKEVHVIEANERILAVLPEKVSTMTTRFLEKKGCHLHTKEIVKEVSKKGLELNSGKKIEADLVILSAGIRCNDMMLQACAINNQLQVTETPEVYIIGDAGKSGRIPTAHNAIVEGKIVAKSLFKPVKEKKEGSSPLLISLGEHAGIISWGNFAVYLPFVGFFKNMIEGHIVRSFRRQSESWVV